MATKPGILPCGRPAPERDTAPVEPEKLERWQARLRAYLVAQKLKYTEQRWKIARLILLSGDHLSAQGIVEAVKRRHPEIGGATVYRNIKVLQDAGLLQESFSDRLGRAVYEVGGGGDSDAHEEHHDHIVCLDCGAIFEFHDEAIEARQSEIARKLKFSVEGHRHVIHAHCDRLQAMQPARQAMQTAKRQ